ncbi:hypothetical protein [Methylocella sp.]|jgi:hypothetical protein|uniref:hypothetical protein n=1 Tax=Methylocella sp. TaxID=1978226 RepID=UPI003C188D5B
MRFKISLIATGAIAFVTIAASAAVKTMPKTTQFCPSWAEAHERSLASINGGRLPLKTDWKGCILVLRGQKAHVVGSDADQTEIIVKGKHWFADEGLF